MSGTEREKQIAEEMAATYHYMELQRDPRAAPPGPSLRAVFAVVAQQHAELEAEAKRVFEANFVHREPLTDPPHFLDVTLPEEAYETMGVHEAVEVRARLHQLHVDTPNEASDIALKYLGEVIALRKAKRDLERKLYNITWHITRAWQEHQR